MEDPAFIAEIRVSPGDEMLIDNHRVMHGRTAFDPSSGSHIRLCHMPRNEFPGLWRKLERRLAPADHDLHLPQGLTHLIDRDLDRHFAVPGCVLAVTSIETATVTAG